MTQKAAPARLEYVRAFFQAAENVISQVLNEAPTKASPIFHANSDILLQEVNVTVGLTGDVAGQITLGMDKPAALRVAGTMMMEEVTAFDEISISALQELTNMISGNGRFMLHDLGVTSDITPPSMLMGRGIKATWHRIRAMSMPLTFSQGTIRVTVGLKQGRN